MSDANVQDNAETTEKQLGGVTGKGFLPGQSGNPGGRPKKKAITELYEKLLEDPEFLGDVEASIRKMVKSGRMVGQLQLKEMTDRLEGKVTQPIEGDVNLTLMSLTERMAKARERASGS